MASVTHYMAEVDNTDVMGPDCYTFDLHAVIAGDDDWTSTCAEATLTNCPDCCTFYQDAFGGNLPIPQFFDAFPTLEYDCWYTGPLGFPNTDVQFEVGFAGATINEDCYLSACWFDTEDTGDGDWVLARYTVCGECCDGATLTVEGSTTIASTGGELHPFSFSIIVPEPASLTLLGLGLFLIRRR
jgi:hypothetical protein